MKPIKLCKARGLFDKRGGNFLLLPCVTFGILTLLITHIIRNEKKWLYILLGSCMMIYWGGSAWTSLNYDYLYGQKRSYATSRFVEIIEGYDSDVPLYFVYDEKTYGSRDIFVLQYYLKNNTIHMIYKDEMEELLGNYALFVEKDEPIDTNKYQIVEQACEMVMLVPKNTEIERAIGRENKSYEWDITDITRCIIKHGIDYFDLTSDYEEGLIAACQYLVLEPGEYEVTYDVYSRNNKDNHVGWVDMCTEYGDDVLYMTQIELQDCVDVEHYQIKEKVTIENETHNVEIRVGTYGKSQMGVNKISYRKIK